MREILFRGKEVADGKWIEGFYSAEEYNPYSGEVEHIPRIQIIGKCVSLGVIPETVGQFTGLTDKNGKRIFEGDIVRYDVNYHDMVISYDVENWGGWLYEDMDDNMQAYSIYEFNLKDIAVIGNIHDNPDILKGGGDNG